MNQFFTAYHFLTVPPLRSLIRRASFVSGWLRVVASRAGQVAMGAMEPTLPKPLAPLQCHPCHNGPS